MYFHWANFICSHLDSKGNLTSTQETKLKVTLDDIIQKKSVEIADEVIEPLLHFVRYTLLGAFQLNKFATGIVGANQDQINRHTESNKRKRIIERMSQG